MTFSGALEICWTGLWTVFTTWFLRLRLHLSYVYSYQPSFLSLRAMRLPLFIVRGNRVKLLASPVLRIRSRNWSSAIMLRGRHSDLPAALDRETMFPTEFVHKVNEKAEMNENRRVQTATIG
jgi:hypothetical protein